MGLGRDWRSFFWSSTDEPSLRIIKVTATSLWTTSRLANSMSGKRCPIPGVGTMAMCRQIFFFFFFFFFLGAITTIWVFVWIALTMWLIHLCLTIETYDRQNEKSFIQVITKSDRFLLILFKGKQFAFWIFNWYEIDH